MKIGSKIALFYTLISVLTTVIIIAVFYIFSTQYINKLYASYLREKAYLTAQKHWEKDEVDEQSYQIIQRKYDELLPEAHEILLNMDSLSEVRDTLNKYLTQHQQALLLAGQDSIPFSFKYKDQLGAALYYPDNEGNFIVLVMSRNAYGTEIKEHLLLLSIFLILASSVLIFFIGKIYSGRILVPLQHILKELKRIRTNSLNRRLKTTGNNDELEDMIKTLNSMLDRLDSAFKAEKSFVSHASHELNNPITAIQGECEISLLKERSTGEYIESLQRISSESKRLSSLIRHLLFLSRQEEELLKNNIEEIILADILKELTASDERIHLHLEETDPQMTVKANPYLLKIALKNIIDNACKYSDKEVNVTLYREQQQVILDIEDRGIGIPQEEIEHILKCLNKNTYQYQEVVRRVTKAGNPPLMNLATSLGRKFVKYCRDTSRVVFNPCLKSDVVKVFQHIYTLKDGEDPKKLYYYVGKKEPMKFTLVNACHIRRITVLEGALDDDFKKFIFDQLSVNFIRNNDYTVVPFLRKYIEEFKKLNSQ